MSGSECSSPAFQEVLSKLADRGVIQGANPVGDWLTFPAITFQCDHKLRISKHGDVRVMRAQYYLPLTLQATKSLHNPAKDETVVEIIFWLIDDEGGITGT
jgi:hypothetical protein